MSLGIGTAGYKRLVKAARIAFKNDHIALGFAKVQLRAEFLKNKNVSDPSQLAELSKGIDEAEELLAFHIVQGRKNSYNTYGEAQKYRFIFEVVNVAYRTFCSLCGYRGRIVGEQHCFHRV